MKQDIKEKWLTALRSGNYKQGRFVLRNPLDQYCCLGVLCDISSLGNWVSFNTYFQYTTKTSGNAEGLCFLPEEVEYSLQLPYNEESKLSDMNDVERMSFEQIANYIENKL
jgi:hypothetical protein